MINAKRAKALRKAVRQYLGDLPKVLYGGISGKPFRAADYRQGLQANGTPHTGWFGGVTRVLVAQGTQRYAYLQAKKHLAAAR